MTLPSETRLCPICASSGEREILYRQRFADDPLGNGYDVVVCCRCGAGFADGIASQAVMDRYYAERSKYTYDSAGGSESIYDFRRFELIVDQLVPHLPSKTARILDVGCATGGLLACLKKRGFENVLGVDPSPSCSAAARGLYGIEVRTATIGDLSFWDEQFDVIIAVGVLEHLQNVSVALEILARRLRNGGLFYCAQPDVGAFADCVNAPFQQFSSEHVNYFSKLSLRNLFVRSRLRARQTWSWLVEWREGIMDSVISGLFARSDIGEALVVCSETRRELCRYIDFCDRSDQALLNRIAEIGKLHTSVILWGAGAQARRLVAEDRFRGLSISVVADQNPHLQGKTLGGIAIVPPQMIANHSEPIVICSQTFAAEIREEILRKWRLTNEIIDLFDRV